MAIFDRLFNNPRKAAAEPIDLALSLSRISANRNVIFLTVIFVGLIFFEVFNYSTTDYALGDLLGGMSFLFVNWSTILAIAFCSIDLAGIARLFTPNARSSESWYLFGAWILAATMNAVLTWWGVTVAVMAQPASTRTVVSHEMVDTVAPIFVAIMVWVIRILLIGSLSLATASKEASGRPARAAQTAPASRVLNPAPTASAKAPAPSQVQPDDEPAVRPIGPRIASQPLVVTRKNSDGRRSS